MSRTTFGGRHELGQNFLNHRPTIARIVRLVAATSGPILELGAGDGALTRELARLGRPVTALELDPRRADRVRRALPGVRVVHADMLRHPIGDGAVVGNIPFHLTTPTLRRLLAARQWDAAVLLTQWEVARKRAGVGGGTMMTAQAAPWFEFTLEGRVAASCFTPAPSVDGGLLLIRRRSHPLVPLGERRAYESFVRAVFTGAGGSLTRVLRRAARASPAAVTRALAAAGVPRSLLPRGLSPAQWAALWSTLRQ